VIPPGLSRQDGRGIGLRRTARRERQGRFTLTGKRPPACEFQPFRGDPSARQRKPPQPLSACHPPAGANAGRFRAWQDRKSESAAPTGVAGQACVAPDSCPVSRRESVLARTAGAPGEGVVSARRRIAFAASQPPGSASRPDDAGGRPPGLRRPDRRPGRRAVARPS